MSASSCVELKWETSEFSLEDFISCSSVNLPETTISLSSGACEINSVYINCARSALFSGRARKLPQFFGRGTSRSSTKRLIGLEFFDHLVLVFPLLETSR